MWSSSKLLLAALLLTTGALAAEPSASDVSAAKNDFSQAMDLREKGENEKALAFFHSAYTLVPTSITALEVGRTELALGRLPAARDTLQAAAAMPEKQGESTQAKEARAEAKKLADEIDARLAQE